MAKIEYMKLGMKSDKDPKESFYSFTFVATKEWTDKESGEIKERTSVYLLSFKAPKAMKVSDELVKRVFDFCVEWNVFEEINKEKGGTVMGVVSAYLTAEKLMKLAGNGK